MELFFSDLVRSLGFQIRLLIWNRLKFHTRLYGDILTHQQSWLQVDSEQRQSHLQRASMLSDAGTRRKTMLRSTP